MVSRLKKVRGFSIFELRTKRTPSFSFSLLQLNATRRISQVQNPKITERSTYNSQTSEQKFSKNSEVVKFQKSGKFNTQDLIDRRQSQRRLLDLFLFQDETSSECFLQILRTPLVPVYRRISNNEDSESIKGGVRRNKCNTPLSLVPSS